MQWGVLQELGACTERERRSPEVDSSRPTHLHCSADTALPRKLVPHGSYAMSAA